MALFSRSIKYEEIMKVAEEKIDQVSRKGETIDRYNLIQYLYGYYASRRGAVDFHEVVDIVDSLYMSGKVRA